MKTVLKISKTGSRNWRKNKESKYTEEPEIICLITLAVS